MTRSTVKRVGITVLCGLIALEVDIWRQASTAPLLLGRIITLPIAILFGPWYGALAALIHAVSGRGIFAAGLRILPLEAIVIGLFARRGRSPMLGGLIVWTAVAGTLIAVPSFYGVGYLRDTILPVALQLVVSGLMAVVVADLIASAAFVQRLVGADQRAARHLRADAFHAFVLAATVPVLVLASVDGQLSSAKQEADGGGRLHEAVAALNQHISAYVNDHEHAVQSLAAALTSLPADGQRRQALLGHYHDVYPGFLTIFAADRLGIVREIFPPRDYRIAAGQRSRVLHERGADQAARGLRRDPRPAVLCADRHHRGADLRRRRRGGRRRGRIARPVEVRQVRRRLPLAARRAGSRSSISTRA